MKSKKFETIIAESKYKKYFVKVEEDALDSLWSQIEGNPRTKVPITAYKDVRQKGYAVVLNGVGSTANLFVLLADWSAYKSKSDDDTFATLMPKVAEIEKYLIEEGGGKK
ncbi:MAG: hypothetical protein QF475_02310 [Candidatus Undinarchaeales archaeon]|jgi:hypothetical protein|nr:hypothetical protein [Candidatus Undinarchaeales archaeon]